METVSSNKARRIAIVFFPWRSEIPYVFISEVCTICDTICEKITIIGGNTDRLNILSSKIKIIDTGVSMHYIHEITPKIFSLVSWFLKCFSYQIIAGLLLFQERKNFEKVVFYMAYPYYLFPLIIAKILRKRCILIVTRGKSTSPLTRILSLQDKLFFYLVDGISPETPQLIDELGLNRYKQKLLPAGARFIDTSVFRYTGSSMNGK
jgi:hypothetical protein